jgi:hypothetical protein
LRRDVGVALPKFEPVVRRQWGPVVHPRLLSAVP